MPIYTEPRIRHLTVEEIRNAYDLNDYATEQITVVLVLAIAVAAISLVVGYRRQIAGGFRSILVWLASLGIRAKRSATKAGSGILRDAAERISEPPAKDVPRTPGRSAASPYVPGAGGIRGSVTRKSDRG